MSEETTMRIEHCHRGLTNAQETIRFIDTKSGVIITVSSALTGWLASKTGALVGCATDHVAVYRVALCLWGLAALLAMLAVLFSVASVCARAPKPDEEKTWLALFPFVKPKDWNEALAVYGKRVQALDGKGILEEYANQLANLGGICHSKLHRHRWAAGFLAASIVSIALLVCAVAVGVWTPRPAPGCPEETKATITACTQADGMEWEPTWHV